MDASTVGLIIGALFGGGGITALVQTFTTRKTAEADATATLSGVWIDNIERLQRDLDTVRKRVAILERERSMYLALLIEHRIPVPVIETQSPVDPD